MKTAQPLTGSTFHYGWIVLAISTVVVFAALGLARFGYSVLLPPMQIGLRMDNAEAGLLATGNLIGYLALSLAGGALAARFGPRAVITVGLIIAGFSMWMTGQAQAFLPALVWRTLTGIGSGASNVPVMGLLASWFTASRRGLASGIAVAGSSLGIILVGPLVPRYLAAVGDTGWRVSWSVFGVTALLIAIIGYLLLRDRPSELGLGPITAAHDEVDPVLPQATFHWTHVYRSRPVWHLGVVYIAFGFSYIIYLTFFTKQLIAGAGYSQEAAGTLFMTMGWFSLFCGLIWGTISDRIGRKWSLVLVYLIHGLAFSMFGVASSTTLFTLSAIMFGLTAWSIPAIMAAACGDFLGPRLAPAALGFLTAFFGIGQAIGPSIAGLVADASGSLTYPYLLAGGVALLGALGASQLRPDSRRSFGSEV